MTLNTWGQLFKNAKKMHLSSKRRKGRPKWKFMDMVREDTKVVDVTEEDAEDRKRWTWMICFGDP